MSEYQSYEFVALDRPLTAREMAELRAISTRADISPTRFWNEYQWGGLKADPAKLMERYFDAHAYLASWGTHRLMLRIPRARVDLKALKPYFVGGRAACLTTTEKHLLLDLTHELEEPEDDEATHGSLAALTPLRSELLRGDLRPAYLAWLLEVSADNLDDDEVEPPVPAGLAELTAAQSAMVDLLRIDVDLVSAAAHASWSLAAKEDAPFRRWLAALSSKEKDAWLRRAADHPELGLGGELLRAFRDTTKPVHRGRRRTVGQLRALAEDERAERETADAERARRAKAQADEARRRHLTNLARDVEGAWSTLEGLVAASDYDVAVKLALDLRDIATREATAPAFGRRFEALRKRQVRRRGFFERWKRANKADGRDR